jgi:prepilin-type N-terminal cleavage/methylation domain-containing protein
MQRFHAGFTLTETLSTIAIAGMLVVATIPALAHLRGDAGTIQDAAQILEIHRGFLHFAADGDGTFPTPGLIDRIGTDPDGLQNYGENNTGYVYSSAIAQLYITTRVVVGPTEVNPVILVDEDYDFDAYDPANDEFWDRDFRDDIWSTDVTTNWANASYAHMAVCGDRRDLKWRDTGAAGDPVLGTRGPMNGVGPGNPLYDRSMTLLLHGDPDVWDGNICFNDHHVELVRTFFPVPTPFALGPDEKHGDNIFNADEGEAGADSWLVIARAAQTSGDSVSETFDPLLRP